MLDLVFISMKVHNFASSAGKPLSDMLSLASLNQFDSEVPHIRAKEKPT